MHNNKNRPPESPQQACLSCPQAILRMEYKPCTHFLENKKENKQTLKKNHQTKMMVVIPLFLPAGNFPYDFYRWLGWYLQNGNGLFPRQFRWWVCIGWGFTNNINNKLLAILTLSCMHSSWHLHVKILQCCAKATEWQKERNTDQIVSFPMKSQRTRF